MPDFVTQHIDPFTGDDDTVDIDASTGAILSRLPPLLTGEMPAAATALGLEIYGGDAIASADGSLQLLDLNAWPSFALYRDEAAPVIASYLALRFGARRAAGGGR